MAFSYRNPIEVAVNALPSRFSDQILSSTAECLVDSVDQLNKNFSYCLTKEAEEALTRKGVELAPIPFRVHSHPVCKTIENHLIYRVVPKMMSKVPSVALVSMREEKAEKFLKVRNFSRYGEIKSLKPLNSFVDAKDNFRYMNPMDLPRVHSEMVANLKEQCNKAGWFPKVVFVHDELHFWTPANLAHLFREIPEIQTLVGTVVFPSELLKKEKVSKNQRIYTFEVLDDQLFFFPDGVASEGYTQSIKNSRWWLETAKLTDFDLSLRITVSNSLYAHHLVIVDRGSLIQWNLMMEKPDCLLNEELRLISRTLVDGVIERNTMLSIILYLSCLKNPNKESSMAKLKQLEKRALFPDEAFLVSSISSTFIKYGVGKDLDDDFLQDFVSSLLGLLPGFLQDFIRKKERWSGIFRDFLKVISVRHFLVQRKVIELYTLYTIEEPLPFTQDRDSRPYSFSKKDFSSSFYSFLFRNLLFSDKIAISSPPVDVFEARRSPGVISPSRGTLLITWNGTEEPETIPEDTSRDSFSCTGVVIQKEMHVNEFIEPSLNYNSRRNKCVFDSIGLFLNEKPDELLNAVSNMDISPELFDAIEDDRPLSLDLIMEVCICLDLRCFALINDKVRKLNLNGRREVHLNLINGHATPMGRKDFSRLINEGGIASSSIVNLEEPALPRCNSGYIQLDFERISKIISSISRGCTGILKEISPSNVEQIKEIFEGICEFKDLFEKQVFEFQLCMGVAGSGKSQSIKKFLNENPTYQSLVVSPRRALAEDWSSSLKGTLHKVQTFETSLTTDFLGLKMLILDEISLYPPGFLDLSLLLHTMRVNGFVKRGLVLKQKIVSSFQEKKDIKIKLYALGDSLQNFYYSPLDSALLPKEPDLNRLLNRCVGKIDYLWYSYRLPKFFEQIFDIQCLGKEEYTGYKFFSELSATKPKEYDCILVASQEDKNGVGFPGVVMTYGESQGMTFDKKVLIGISASTMASSENSLIVALTRSKRGFDFFLMQGKTVQEVMTCLKKKMLGYVLQKKKIPAERLLNLMPNGNINMVRLNGFLEDKASNDPFISPEIQQDHPLPDLIEEETILIHPEWMKTHMPVSSINPLLGEIFEKMELKEKREFWHQVRGFSAQFPDTDKGLIEDVMGYPFRFDSIFPRHNGEDDVTFWEGVKKRLRFSNPREERSHLEVSRRKGAALLDIFIKMLPERFEVTTEDIEIGLNGFNKKRAEKTEALWLAHSERSDIDWPLNHVFLFMKSQLCTKQEKMFTKAKAGQTLACFHHIVLFRFGPMLRAIERAFMRACGHSYYIHSGKNFNALNYFVVQNSDLFQGNSIESDYEAFDSSQDSMILAFEEKLLLKIGVAESFVNDYIDLKLNLGCRLGSLAIMRFTGEFCTFLFNTFANMLFTGIKYDINPKVDRILFAGDDMASIGPLKKSGFEKQKMLEMFTLKAKEDIKKIPSFCGWFLTPYGIIKSPKLLWARISLMKQRGMIAKCLDSYFLEAVFAYNLGEKLFDLFDEEDIEYHYIVSRFFVKNKYRFSGEAKTAFFGCKDSFGAKCPSSKSMTSPSELKKKTLRLMLYVLRMCMATLPSCIQRFFNQSDVLKAISKWGILRVKNLLCLISNCLMKLKLNTYVSRVQNTPTCTLVPYSYVLHLSSRITVNAQAIFACMMARLLIWKQVSLRPIDLISPRDKSTLFLGQSISSPAQTLFSMKHSRFFLRFLASTSRKGGRLLAWTLDAFTGFLIRLVTYVMMKLMEVGRNRKFGDVRCLTMDQKSADKSETATEILKSKFQIWMSDLDPEVLLCLFDKLEGRNLFRSHKMEEKKFILSCLSQTQLNLINQEKKRIQMASVQSAIRLAIRQVVDQWLWDNHVDPDHQILAEGTLLVDTPQNLVNSVNQAQLHYKSHLFGNVAILGSSGKTQWPNIDVMLPTLILPIPDGENVVKNYWLNLSTIVPALETLRATHQLQIFKKSTFRQVCECYASEAYIFLRRSFGLGVSTNIYKKWPKALEPAPWLAFDFVGGLNMNDLTPDEKKVLDRLTKRLFRTEGQKGVFEAGQEVNVDLEG